MDKVAIYLRKSRAEEQGEDIGETLSRHKSTLLDFAKKNKLNIIKIYEEVVSGESLFARPQMLELLQAIEENMYDAVLCMDIDRLGRGNMKDQGTILQTFKAANTLIITPRKVYDLDNDLDEQYSEFEALMARNEYKSIRRRMQNGRTKSIQEGCYVANAPFGYVGATVNKKPTLEIYESEAKYVRMIYDMYVNQGIGTYTIASTLNAMGVNGKRGGLLSRTTVRTIISNPVYTGKIVWNRTKHLKKKTTTDKHKTIYNDKAIWILSDGLHPAIIDEETFNKAQDIRIGRGHPPSNKGILENPLAGLIYCANCGQLMQRAIPRHKNDTFRILCVKKDCVRGNRLDLVESEILRILEVRLKEFEFQNSEKSNDSTIDLTSSQIEKINNELKKIDNQKNKLYDLLEQGVYTIDIFTERSNALANKKTKLEAAMNKIVKNKKDESKKSPIIPRLKYVLENYWQSNAGERNKMLKDVVKFCVYNKTKDQWGNVFDIKVFIDV